jgi:hypothetical protein
MAGRDLNPSDAEINAIAALARGATRKDALKHAHYSEKTRRHGGKAVLEGRRMQAAARQVGLALATPDNPKYGQALGILQDRNAAPALVLETVKEVCVWWECHGKQETNEFSALPEVAKVLLRGNAPLDQFRRLESAAVDQNNRHQAQRM